MGCFTELEAMRQIRPRPPACAAGPPERVGRTQEVRVDRLEERGVVHLERSSLRRAARVPHHDVEALNRSGRLDQSSRRIGLGHVCGERKHLGASLGGGRP